MLPILVVDDESSFLASIAEGLSTGSAPYQVLTASDGAHAIAELTRTDVSVVMTDLKMPGVDGFELLAWLVANRPGTPVIVMTAFGTPTIEDRVVDGGAIHFIEKPFDVNAARRAIARIVDNSDNAAIALPDLLRLVMHERRSGILRLGFGEDEGAVAVHEGVIVGAAKGAKLDAAAAAAMQRSAVTWFSIDLRDTAIATQLRTAIGAAGPTPPLRLKDFLVAATEDDVDEAPAAPTGNVEASFAQALELDGALGVALVDFTRATVLRSARSNSRLDVELAAAGNAELIRETLTTLERLGIDEPIEDIVVTLSTQYHLLRTSRRYPNIALYITLDRDRGSLAIARMQLADIEQRLEI